ncbi:hypothetical protein [Marinibactrum halimedae]|uniref:Uncharacterized protein n=1 Tax=Marinibactrum halimedae TaxID=1444977 RepID=A0AA37T6T0_9GAMM|nr:hypothetical protein [Marinibactrum halimedae]MCD9461322.1 hypothetical protein [Marinibactrum halimedae]GLS24625.1 hypothetical protein GCM10007877_03390 [Marinibactrum halimedae]
MNSYYSFLYNLIKFIGALILLVAFIILGFSIYDLVFGEEKNYPVWTPFFLVFLIFIVLGAIKIIGKFLRFASEES